MLRKYYPHYMELLKLGIPLVLTQAGQMSVQLIDNAMIGRSGTAALAASSFANNVYVVLMLLGLGIFLGVTPLVGHARGAHDDRPAENVVHDRMFRRDVDTVVEGLDQCRPDDGRPLAEDAGASRPRRSDRTCRPCP